ncbi:MAG: ferredoxin--NADP reductase [Rhodocyclaceae bacterium]
MDTFHTTTPPHAPAPSQPKPPGVRTDDRCTLERITHIHHWTERLLSFRCTRYRGFRFAPGQFARLGLTDEDGHLVWRAFSMVSAPYDDYLEFLAIIVPDGAFTRQLAKLGEGDTLQVDKTAYGFLTTDRFRDGEDLWLLATGTGLAPFLSILRDPDTWTRYRHVILAHSVRTEAELAYRDSALGLRDHPLLGDAAERLVYLPIVTREDTPRAVAHQRISALLGSGALAAHAGLTLAPGPSRIMICGNPEMLRDTRNQLKSMGFSLSRRERPGHYAVENAF